MQSRAEKLRAFYAEQVCSLVKSSHPEIARAFAAVPREPFAGPGPWSLSKIGAPYVTTPDDDPAFLYQDLLLALDSERRLNIGMPSAHAFWLSTCDIKAGDTVLQVGAGTGYYTNILAHLVGRQGRVYAYEIREAFADRARDNLGDWPQVELRFQSGVTAELPVADVIYVCAGTVGPAKSWLTALRPGGRLLFPLAPEGIVGAMMLITRPPSGSVWPAAMINRTQFIGCVGLHDINAASELMQVFETDWQNVRSLRLDGPPDESCWYAGDGWWLSRSAA